MQIFLTYLLHYFWAGPREAMEMLHLSEVQYALWNALGQVIYGAGSVIVLLLVTSVARFSQKKA
jgi:hypothetical protein